MSIIAKYKFNQMIYENFIPEFNSTFTDYTITDEIGTDGYTIRTIESNDLPTLMRFGAETQTDREKSLLEVYECNTENITTMQAMFQACSSLTSLNVSNFNTGQITNMYAMFALCSKLTSLDVSNFDTSQVTNMHGMFYVCSSLTSLDISNFDTSQVTTMTDMFNNCSSITSLDVSNFNTEKVTNMKGMFYGCSSLISLDVSNFNTSQVTNMNNMFSNCASLTSLDISNFNTEKVDNMSYMFYLNSKLTSLDVSNFNTSNVTNMSFMFHSCSSLTSLDLSNFDTSNVTSMANMFNGCSSLISLNVSKFETGKVNNMGAMFNNCSSLTSLDVSNFDVSQTKDMTFMFAGSSLTSLDLSSFKINQTANINYMFRICNNLTFLDISNFDIDDNKDIEQLFYNTLHITDIGMIYCNSDTINKIVNLLTTNTTIWYSEDEVNVEDLDVLENITYKPYKENRISYDGITLRSLPNGVKDEINVLTGEKVERIGEFVLNGNDETWDLVQDRVNTMRLNCHSLNIPIGVNGSLLKTDKFPYQSPTTGDQEGAVMGGGVVSPKVPSISILKTRLPSSDIDGFKQWLSQNPITVQYELATPVIHQLDAQSLTPYQDGYISMEAEINYPSFIYSLPSTNTFYIPKIKNMAQYTLKYPVGSGTVTIGNIKYNVTSDSMLFTTPIEITGDKNSLVFETDDNPTDIMILEGNYSDREVKYFTGINSVINPIIRVTNSLTGGSVEYKGNSDIALYSLPNKMSDKLDVLTGYLMRVTGIREYQDGDYELDNVFTDGVNTVYKLDSPLLYRNINFPIPTLNGYGTIELDSDEAIPQLNYRVLSNNYYPIELLEPNTTYTMIGEAQANTTFTLGGTYIGNYSGGKLVVNLGNVNENSLKFSNDIGLKNFMLVKGDATNSTLPFYTGIKSVENITFNIKGFDGQENSLALGDSIVLRKCGNVYDSIDLINGVMTKQLNEIVLTGTEIWSVETSKSVDSNYQLFSLATTSAKDSKNATIYCDKLLHNYLATSLNNQECIYFENNKLYLCIKKITIGGDNVNALKTWLTKNNMTIIYPLINSVKINLDTVWEVMPPISYETQTEFDSNVASGSLKPILAVTVATTTLEEIVSDLNAKNRQLEAESLVTMLAVTEVYEMIYGGATTMSLKDSVEPKPTVMSINEIEEEIEQTAMGKIYVKLIKAGMKTIEQVPYFLQEEVIYYLNKE